MMVQLANRTPKVKMLGVASKVLSMCISSGVKT